ncbi:unnamed protein product [Mesocestoides corti]|uniref:Uncharacterized protein n=1 Tax=Mesocestoides corti TaxID=53468 RepID=A0A0R3UJI0_MESCO|nr:unnamed protein product [Mesocestoides corti]
MSACTPLYPARPPPQLHPTILASRRIKSTTGFTMTANACFPDITGGRVEFQPVPDRVCAHQSVGIVATAREVGSEGSHVIDHNSPCRN